jgi:hypothetical protein
MIDRTGETYGRLTIIGDAPRENKQARRVFVQCNCEAKTIKSVLLHSLRCGETKSCGCWCKENAKVKSTTHGMTKHPLYRIWAGIIKRCTNPNNKSFKNYGGRGIFVCNKWKKFENFYSDMHQTYKPELSIERIDNDKGYSPDNCKWATNSEQVRNRRMTIFITMNGKTQCVKDWANEMNVNYRNSLNKLKKGKSPHEIFNIKIEG